jgi:pimeloyl-ACP methyl ester carboxylesterase
MSTDEAETNTRQSSYLGDFEERFVSSVDGLRLYVRDYAPLEPATGAPVFLLHGLTRNSRDFEIVAARIAALGRRVIVPDMRGRARSAYDSDPAHYVPAVYAQDVARIMDELGMDRAVFIGTSMGGIITMVLAALQPERIAAAALNDIGPRLDSTGIQRIASYVGAPQAVSSWAEAAEAARSRNGVAFPARLDDGEFWDVFARRTYKQGEDGALRLDYDANIALALTDPETASPVDMTPLFEALNDKPVLSIRGEISDLLAPDGVEHMRAIKPDLVSVEVPNVGHAPTLEEDEAWLALVDFLAVVP